MPNTIWKKHFYEPGVPCYTVSSQSPDILCEGTFVPSGMEEPLDHAAICFSGR